MKKIMFFLIGILLSACCMSCGKKKEVSYTEDQLRFEIEEILSKPRFTEEEWKKLDELLSWKGNHHLPGFYGFTDDFYSRYKIPIRIRHRDNAVQTKNWRLLKLLARYDLLRFDDYVRQLKRLNYSDEEVLKFLTLPNQKIDRWTLVRIQDVGLLKLLLPHLTEKDRNFFKGDDYRPGPDQLQAAYRAGLIDDDKALLECERHFRVENIDLLNELLRRKRQSSKVWTLY